MNQKRRFFSDILESWIDFDIKNCWSLIFCIYLSNALFDSLYHIDNQQLCIKWLNSVMGHIAYSSKSATEPQAKSTSFLNFRIRVRKTYISFPQPQDIVLKLPWKKIYNALNFKILWNYDNFGVLTTSKKANGMKIIWLIKKNLSIHKFPFSVLSRKLW